MPDVISAGRTLYEEAPDEFELPVRAGDPASGVKVFRKVQSSSGVVVYSTALTRDDLLKDRSAKRQPQPKK